MDKLINQFCKLLDGVIAAMLALMVVLVFGNVVLRYGFNSGITVSEELSRWFFVWLTFLGAISALNDHGHLGTDMLVSKMPRAGKVVLKVISLIIMLYVTWLLFDGSLAQTKINADVAAPTSGLSVAIFYASGIVFAVSSAVLLLRELVITATGKATDADLVMVQESEDLAQATEEAEAATHHGPGQHGERK